MINSWSLLYDEIYGDQEMTEDIKITSLESDEYDPKPQSDSDDADWNEPVITVGSGNTASAYASVFNINLDTITDVSIDTAGIEGINLEVDPNYIAPEFVNFSMEGVNLVDDAPSSFTAFSDNDDSIAHLIDKPVSSGIEDNSPRKYKEDESIEALKNYISTTYGGHYTSKENNVQTLDLIESVGDAESFCRSNAIKYLSRYDKKGQAKRDILKALHYSLLLYHFSGQLNETPTRGYETF